MKFELLRGVAATLAIAVAGALLGLGAVSLWHQASSGPQVLAGNYVGALEATQSPWVLFSASTCPYCKKAKRLLDEERISYAVLEIDQSDTARQWFKQYGGEGVPMLVNASQALVGFDAERYREFLGLADSAQPPSGATAQAEAASRARSRRSL